MRAPCRLDVDASAPEQGVELSGRVGTRLELWPMLAGVRSGGVRLSGQRGDLVFEWRRRLLEDERSPGGEGEVLEAAVQRPD